MVNPDIKVIFGGGQFSTSPEWSAERVQEILTVLKAYNVQEIDTSQAYPGSEELLGQYDVASQFTLDTKDMGRLAGQTATKQEVVARGEESLRKLKTPKVDTFYLHVPDRKTPLAETLAGINELYKAGKFAHFGISNFRVDEVEEVMRIAKENDYIRPTVYQGLYSAVTRRQESELFPVLRKHNIAFYAYSPLASGFLVKTREQMQKPTGRWDPDTYGGKIFNSIYGSPDFLDFLDGWQRISAEAKISKAELGYRWVAYNSQLRGELGDAIIVGASSHRQLKQTLEGLKNGPLSEEVTGKINDLWSSIEKAAPFDL